MSYVNGKVVIVTGASRGIGFVTVQHFLRNGAKYVAIFDVIKPDSEAAAETLQKLSVEFDRKSFGYYSCDVTNNEEFRARYDEVAKSHGYVDVLVNNAGKSNENAVDSTIALNFTAVVKCTLTAIERMGKHKGHKGGAVVNIGSIYGLTGIPMIPLYSATKHAVVSFVRALKEHNQTLGMKIVSICPGLTKTNMTTGGDPKDILYDFVSPKIIENHLKLYLQSPDNVASAVIEILERGREGDVWLAQNDEPAFAV